MAASSVGDHGFPRTAHRTGTAVRASQGPRPLLHTRNAHRTGMAVRVRPAARRAGHRTRQQARTFRLPQAVRGSRGAGYGLKQALQHRCFDQVMRAVQASYSGAGACTDASGASIVFRWRIIDLTRPKFQPVHASTTMFGTSPGITHTSTRTALLHTSPLGPRIQCRPCRPPLSRAVFVHRTSSETHPVEPSRVSAPPSL